MTTYTPEQIRENRRKWIDALRSEKYPQTVGWLHDKHGYCCMGVLCEIAGLKSAFDEDGEYWFYEDIEMKTCPQKARDFVGLKDPTGIYKNKKTGGTEVLTHKNDNGINFDRIADIIESEPEGLFIKLEDEK